MLSERGGRLAEPGIALLATGPAVPPAQHALQHLAAAVPVRGGLPLPLKRGIVVRCLPAEERARQPPLGRGRELDPQHRLNLAGPGGGRDGVPPELLEPAAKHLKRDEACMDESLCMGEPAAKHLKPPIWNATPSKVHEPA